METKLFSQVFLSVALVFSLGLLFRLYTSLVALPRQLRSALATQGITGPPPNFLLGNILEMKKAKKAAGKASTSPGSPALHNSGAILLPFFDHWRKKYGDVFMFALGNTQILLVTDPEMVKEITTCTSLDLGKPTYQARELGSLLGQGILTSNGPYWAHQRKIIAPELYMEKVKGMVNLIQDSSMALVQKWKSIVEAEGGLADIKIDEHLRTFSGDVISKACFGSNYSKGEDIFLKLRALQEVVTKIFLSKWIPGIWYLPTKSNREAWALDKEIKTLILKVVNQRKASKDLLQMLVQGAENSNLPKHVIDRFVVDNCKNIYMAGYETTAVSATWCLMLLASHPQWQQRIRDEVLAVCDGRIPDYEMIRKMKLLTMAINETLRLYPPAFVISREVLKDMQFRNLKVPNGVNLWTLVTTLHTDPQIWGLDSYEFNPQRFANGIMGATKFPHLYMPFGVGPRVCLGQNLAMMELKILIALILSTFSLSISPKYVHKPALNLNIEPGYGVNLLLKEL